jgi:hypothetical protein
MDEISKTSRALKNKIKLLFQNGAAHSCVFVGAFILGMALRTKNDREELDRLPAPKAPKALSGECRGRVSARRAARTRRLPAWSMRATSGRLLFETPSGASCGTRRTHKSPDLTFLKRICKAPTTSTSEWAAQLDLRVTALPTSPRDRDHDRDREWVDLATEPLVMTWCRVIHF